MSTRIGRKTQGSGSCSWQKWLNMLTPLNWYKIHQNPSDWSVCNPVCIMFSYLGQGLSHCSGASYQQPQHPSGHLQGTNCFSRSATSDRSREDPGTPLGMLAIAVPMSLMPTRHTWQLQLLDLDMIQLLAERNVTAAGPASLLLFCCLVLISKLMLPTGHVAATCGNNLTLVIQAAAQSFHCESAIVGGLWIRDHLRSKRFQCPLELDFLPWWPFIRDGCRLLRGNGEDGVAWQRMRWGRVECH